ncbi:MAG: ABC transporter ATP-binding protein [Thalassospira sp.]|nr:ABC transporter ATP-binding protein [Thalassospira sp.]
MTAPVLTIKNLTARFPGTVKPCLDAVSLTVAPGETLAIVGESGSGKTVLGLSVLNLLAGQLDYSPESQIILQDTPILSAAPKTLQSLRGRVASCIFQEPMTALNPLQRLGKQLAEALTLHQPGLSRSELDRKIHAVFQDVELPPALINRYPHQLSGGQRQRVLIALALLNDPLLLIADEPTTALDAHLRHQLLALLKKIQAQRNLAVLLITHDLHLVRQWAHRVMVLQHGRVVESGEKAALLAHPQEAYTRQLFNQQYPPNPTPKAANGAAPIVSLRGVGVSVKGQGSFWKSSQHTILAPLSVDVLPGQTLGVIGESGSGKTTLARALLRLMPSVGEIIIAGKNWQTLQGKALRAARSAMQIVFQDPFGSLHPRLLIEQIIVEGWRGTAKPDCSALLAQVGLPADFARRYPHELSGGQRQRVALARALAVKPQVLVLDEPTSALDANVAAEVVVLLQKLQAEQGLTYILVSHDLNVIRALSHQVLVLKGGQVVEGGSLTEVFGKPKDDYTKILLGSVDN